MAQPRVRLICYVAVLFHVTVCFNSAAANQNAGDQNAAEGDSSLVDKVADFRNAHNRLKRDSQFMGLGQQPVGDFVRNARPSSFVRIGKGNGGADEGRYDNYGGYDNLLKKASSFVRIGRANPAMNRFIRIGKNAGDDSSNMDDLMYATDPSFEKRQSSFVRFGKRPSSFVRIGKSGLEDEIPDKRTSSFVRIGKSDPYWQQFAPEDAIKRGSHFVRIGRGPSNFVRIGRSPSSFVRIGKAPSNFVRIGKSDMDALDNKRASSFVRIGKNSDYGNMGLPNDYDKRASNFVRFGRDSTTDQELMKRVSSFVRIGKGAEEDKRASSFVRIGKSGLGDEEEKRASSFVRIGKSGLDDNGDSVDDLGSEAQKKASSFVRIGKALSSASSSKSSSSDPSVSSSPADPSPSSMETMDDGNLVDDDKPHSLSSRMSGFVRIGKIPAQAFMRVGKNNNYGLPAAIYSRGTRGSGSSFIRIGK